MLANFALPETFGPGVFMSVVYAVLGLIFLLAGFKLFDLMLSKVDFQQTMKSDHKACAIIIAAFFLALSYIVGQVIH